MPAILFVAAIVLLVWATVVFVRGGLLVGCLTVLLAGCCFGYPFFHLAVKPIPLTADRILWGVLMVQGVVWWRLGRTDSKRPGSAEFVLAAFFAVLILNTLAHDWRADGFRPLAHLLFYYLMPLGMYWVACQAKVSERGVVRMFACLGAFGVYLAVTALAETRQISWLVWPQYIGSEAIPDFFGRGRGPLLNPVGNGLLMGLCLSAVLVLWPRAGRPGKALLLFAALMICLGMYATLTRSVWLGAGFGTLLLLGLTLPRSWRVPVLAGFLLVALAVGLTQWERILALKRDQGVSAQEGANSVKLRPIMAVVAWKMFVDRPLVGCGFGHYAKEHDNYLADRSSELPLEKARPYDQHNVFLSLLVETGLTGAGLFGLTLTLWIRDSWRITQSSHAPIWARQQAFMFLAWMGNFVVNGMLHDPSVIPGINMVLFFMAGLTVGLRLPARPIQSP
jgi:hypothetical protein